MSLDSKKDIHFDFNSYEDIYNNLLKLNKLRKENVKLIDEINFLIDEFSCNHKKDAFYDSLKDFEEIKKEFRNLNIS